MFALIVRKASQTPSGYNDNYKVVISYLVCACSPRGLVPGEAVYIYANSVPAAVFHRSEIQLGKKSVCQCFQFASGSGSVFLRETVFFGEFQGGTSIYFYRMVD
jgi:hypothetical protein